ncbi:MAG: NAD(P)/FAD-dependent oxidoreductase [Candidatus Helarchaeota archaeon]|nr:NAD(P)/FAD-dependent oxidoreductase [Candidatus Helarchaeota archaeon]
MKEQDVIIAGAGPVGCIFALTLKEDISITILERKAKEELGHDWTDGFDRSIVENQEILQYVSKLMDTPAADFYTPDGQGRLSAPLTGRIDIDRKELARSLVSAIEKRSNITFIEHADIQSPLIENNCVMGLKFTRDNQEQIIKSNLVVDTTGFSAVLRRKLPPTFSCYQGDLKPPDTFLTFRKYIKRPQDLQLRQYRILFGKYRALSWINTELEAWIDFLATVPNFPGHKDPKAIVEELEQTLIQETRLRLDLTPIRANYYSVIPMRRCLDSFCENNFLLIGDAACQVEPITGSGIASGMIAGFIAAQHVNSLFAEHKPLSKENLWHYNYEWIKQVGAQFAALDVIRLFLLSLSEQDYNFLIRNRIITEEEFRKSLSGEKLRIGLVTMLQKVWRGWTRLGLLLDLNRAIQDSNKIKDIYYAYPLRFDEQAFKLWQKRKDSIINRYYKRIETRTTSS